MYVLYNPSDFLDPDFVAMPLMQALSLLMHILDDVHKEINNAKHNYIIWVLQEKSLSNKAD